MTGSTPASSTSRWGSLPLLALGALLLAGAAELWLFRTYMVDDAYITLRYVRNLLAGQGLVFNPGDRVEGFSNPLLLFLTAGLGAIGVPLITGAKSLGLASYLATLAIMAVTLRRFSKGFLSPATLLVALALVATSFPVTFFAVTGMETIPYAAVVVALYVTLLRERFRVTPLVALLLFLGMLSRVEGIMLVGVTLVAGWIERRGEGPRRLWIWDRREIWWLGALVVATAALVALRWLYYGTFLPNTFYAKLPWTADSRVPWLARGLDDVMAFLRYHGGPLGVVVLMGPLALRSTTPPFRLSLVFLAFFVAFQKYAGGDWMVGARYMVPVVAVYALGVAGAIEILRERLPAASPRALHLATLAAVLALSAGGVVDSMEFRFDVQRYPNNVQTSIGLREISEWIDENVPPEHRVVNWRIGALSYFCQNPIIDTWGLVDAKIARIRAQAVNSKAVEREVSSYVASLQPEVRIEGYVESDSVGTRRDGWLLAHEGRNGEDRLGIWVREPDPR